MQTSIHPTYRQAVQMLIESLNGIYQDIAYMRDQAFNLDEHTRYNKTRGLLYEAMNQLQTIDNALTDQHAACLITRTFLKQYQKHEPSNMDRHAAKK